MLKHNMYYYEAPDYSSHNIPIHHHYQVVLNHFDRFLSAMYHVKLD